MIDFLKKNKKYVHSVLFLSTFGKSLCADEEMKEEPKKEPEFRKELNGGCFKDGSFISGNLVVKPSIKSKDIVVKNFKNKILDTCFWIKPNIELTGKFFFDLNKDDSDDIIKKIESSGKIVVFNCYPVGTFIKNKSKANGIRDSFYFDNLKFSVAFWEKQLNDNLYIKIKSDANYGESEYVRNEDLRIFEIRFTAELKKILGGQEFKFDPSLGFIFNSDNSLQVIEILKEKGDFAWTRMFTDGNIGVADIAPSIGIKCNVDHELFNGGIKIYFGYIEAFTNKNFKFDLLLNFGWKKDLSIVKNLKGSIGLGFDSDMSYFFNDKVSFSDKFYIKATDEEGNPAEGYLLFRPRLFNFNVSCDIDYTSLIKNVDKLWFVSEASSSLDLKFETIFGLAIDYCGTKEIPKDLGKSFYLRLTWEALKTKLNGSNIENEKVKFLLDNLKLDILKLSGGFSSKKLNIDPDNSEDAKFDEIGFDLGITLAKGEFEWAKYGLTFNASIFGDSFGCASNKEGWQWRDFLSIGCKWNFAKYWENRNN